MTVLNVKKDEHFITGGNRVENIFCLVKGSVYQLSHEDEMKLEAGSIIGIMDCMQGEYLCDYVAAEDCVIYAYSYRKEEDLNKIYESQPGFAPVFLRAVIKETALLIGKYEEYRKLAKKYYSFCVEMCRQYRFLCSTYQIPEKMAKRTEFLKPFEAESMIPEWKVNYYKAFGKASVAQINTFCAGNANLVTGQVLSAAEDMKNAVRLIDEIKDYFECNQNILLCGDKKDIFQMFFEIAKRAALISNDVTQITDELEKQKKFIEESGIYENDLIFARMTEYNQCDFTTLDQKEAVFEEEQTEEQPEEEGEDCFAHILLYAGFEKDAIEKVRAQIITYRELPDMLSTDDTARKLRKSITDLFYEIYLRIMKKAVNDNGLSPIVKMFLNFGFLDVSMVGEENANELYDLTDRLFLCESEHVYTIFSWLKSIYDGKNEPCKNEFDLDYPAFLREESKQGRITAEQEETLKNDNWNKVIFEINHMFKSTNKTTYGSILTFCPVLAKHDLQMSIENMIVTAEKIESAWNSVREIDFRVFYHDVIISDPEHGIVKEVLKKEIFPQVILMPNVGTRAMMWQETSGIKRDTPARFVFPIFAKTSVSDMMLETIGRYRWEFCRKVQGARWNDISDKSLTAEYCDYIQFYRKNRELTADAKEKIKNELFRAKNNYREAFVKDYINWIKYEANGSFRLNKVSRTILFAYCPFSEKNRNALIKNPIFQPMIERMHIMNERELKRVNAVYEKYKKSGGELTEDMKDSLYYYQK